MMAAVASRKRGEHRMSEAQIGLTVAAPLIVIFALALHRMGALRGGATLAAVAASVAIAVVLFATQ